MCGERCICDHELNGVSGAVGESYLPTCRDIIESGTKKGRRWKREEIKGRGRVGWIAWQHYVVTRQSPNIFDLPSSSFTIFVLHPSSRVSNSPRWPQGLAAGLQAAGLGRRTRAQVPQALGCLLLTVEAGRWEAPSRGGGDWEQRECVIQG
ncbi:hypothetical protein E3N88_31668 [Mikania micrantha]|uniref:Uncharacterized protein n=1 Tax=Mikania micrantha TaxID=192012 RepID=A0A5N6M6B8_9ASTR|nr:hypothetical protein E3N88_31668 [Mikania micrantha]